MDSNHDKQLKVLILSAGLGTRLKPLTDVLPKPAAPVLNTPLIDAAIFRCIDAGIRDIAINVFHLPQIMTDYAINACQRLAVPPPHVSREFPEVLGTGGALAQISGWWQDETLVVYNGDILSDISLRHLVTKHERSGSIVTMAVRAPHRDSGSRSIWVTNGEVKAICREGDLPKNLDRDKLHELGFACAYVADPSLKQFLPPAPNFSDIVTAFNAAIASGKRISSVEFPGFWADLGTPKSLWETNIMVASLRPEKIKELLGHNHFPRICSAYRDVEIDEHSVIGPNVILSPGAKIIKSVLLDGSLVRPGEIIDHSIKGLGLDHQF